MPKKMLSARVDRDLLARVSAAAAERGVTLTQAIEDGLRRWLRARAGREAGKEQPGSISGPEGGDGVRMKRGSKNEGD